MPPSMSRAVLFSLLLSALPLFAQTATIRGRVVDEDNHQPVANANVYAADLRGADLETKSAADGTYSFAVEPGRWFVQANDSARVEMWSHTKCAGVERSLCGLWGDPIDVAAGETRSGIDFGLSVNVPFGTIKGKITAGPGVRFIDLITGLEWRGKAVASDGSFSYNLPPRNYLVVSNDGTILHGLSDGNVCVDPCPWIKTPAVNLAAGATATVNIVHPNSFGVMSVEPDNGRAAGGTHYTLKGLWYFDIMPFSVLFGSAAAPVTQSTYTVMSGFTPPGTGTTNIGVTGRFQRTAGLAGAFHYFGDGESFLALTAPNAPVRMGSDTTVVMTLTPPRGSDTTVSLSSSNLSVPASVTIPANSESVTFTAHPLGYGGGKITATAPGAASSSVIVQVIAPKLTVTVPSFVPIHTDAPVTVTLDPPQPTDTTVIAWGVDSLYEQPGTIPANQAGATFAFHDLPPHFQLYLPTYLGGGFSDLSFIYANASENGLTSDTTQYRLDVGGEATAHLRLLKPSAGDTAVTFTLQGNAVSVSPSTITIPAATNDATFTIRGVTPGTALVYAAADGVSKAAFLIKVYQPPPASRRHAK